MQNGKSKKLVLNKKTVSVLQSNEMAALKGGAALPGLDTSRIICGPSDSFVACGSCFGACPTNTYLTRDKVDTIVVAF
jgi:NAD-dependent dihydropyrimidine dehydrogenase PreA subunit